MCARAQACPPRQFRPIKREPSGALLRRHLPIGTVEAARWRLVNVAGPGGSRYEGNGPFRQRPYRARGAA